MHLDTVELSWCWLGAAGFAGSRSGALIATAWASLVHQGEQGFMRITHQLMQVLCCGSHQCSRMRAAMSNLFSPLDVFSCMLCPAGYQPIVLNCARETEICSGQLFHICSVVAGVVCDCIDFHHTQLCLCLQMRIVLSAMQLVTATVHGECQCLAPFIVCCTLRVSFNGTMQSCGQIW